MDAADMAPDPRAAAMPAPDRITVAVKGAFSLLAALDRAAFLLRRDGNGAYDRQQADVLERFRNEAAEAVTGGMGK